MDDVMLKVGEIVVVFVAITISMTLHEIMHGFIAYKLGDDTAKEQGRLTLNPIEHLDPVYSVALPLVLFLIGGPIFGGAKPVPVDFRNVKGGVWGMALVAIAGPVVNLVLAFLGFLGYAFIDGGEIVSMICYYFMMVNLGFCCFNILPIPPLDGSRVVYTILPDRVREFYDNLERGVGVWLVYILIFVFGGFFSEIIGNIMNGVYQFFCWIIGL